MPSYQQGASIYLLVCFFSALYSRSIYMHICIQLRVGHPQSMCTSRYSYTMSVCTFASKSQLHHTVLIDDPSITIVQQLYIGKILVYILELSQKFDFNLQLQNQIRKDIQLASQVISKAVFHFLKIKIFKFKIKKSLVIHFRSKSMKGVLKVF